jgi:sec-independent protein translocase protein TatA
MSEAILALGMPGPFEMLIIAGLGLLMFGRRLPDVAKGLGRSVVEFKKGLKEVTDDIDPAVTPPKPPANPPASNPPTA